MAVTRRHFGLFISAITGVMLVVTVLSAAAFFDGESILYAAPSSSGSGDCSSWANACDLQTALSNSVSGDQVWALMGLYKPTASTDRTISFDLVDGVALYGGFDGTETTLDERSWELNQTVLSGDIDNNDLTDPYGVVTDTANIVGSNSYHVVVSVNTSNTTVLDGLYVTAGQADGLTPYQKGGGIYSTLSNLVLSNLVIRGNYALGGGGMSNDTGSPILNNLQFLDNTSNGGGGGMSNGGDPIISNSTFSNNSAGSGGGGMSNGGSPVLNQVTFISNSAHSGGGMNNGGGNPDLTNVAFNNNSVEFDGGGIANTDTQPTLTNVSFTGNIAGRDGGGVYTGFNVTLFINNAVFSNNTADLGGAIRTYGSGLRMINASIGNNSADFGGGFYNESVGVDPILVNSIFWGNTASSGGDQIFNIISLPIISYSDIQGSGGSGVGWDSSLGVDAGGNIDVDPLFVDSLNNDLHLSLPSPAIDAGNNFSVTVSLDIDNGPRFIDVSTIPDTGMGNPPIVDMGADEYLDFTSEIYLPIVLRSTP